jgi:hypothetical protein
VSCSSRLCKSMWHTQIVSTIMSMFVLTCQFCLLGWTLTIFFLWSNFFGQIGFGNQKFLVTKFFYHWIGQPFNILVQFDNWKFSLNFFECYSNFFGSPFRNVLGVSPKFSIIQMTLAIDPTFQFFFVTTQKNLVVNFHSLD